MKKKIVIILTVLLLIVLGYIICNSIIKPNPSKSRIQQGILEKDQIRNNIQNVINGIDNPDVNYEISISEARDKAIVIFNSLGETDLNKDNVQVVEVNREGKKFYYIRSAKNSAEIEINTGKVVRINNVAQ